MSRTKIVTLGSVFVLAMATGASAAYSYWVFDGYIDYAVTSAQDTPCYAGMNGPAQPVTFDNALWLVFTCADGNVVARRLHISSVSFDPAYTPPINPTYTGLPNPPGSNSCAEKYPGFVESTTAGGCVPPDHPSAKR
jgi:hypothetical protein